MQLIDSHCHLDAAEFDPDRAQVLQRADAAGIVAQLVPATTAAGWPKLRQVCQAQPGLYPAYGLHPVFLSEHRPDDLDQLQQWIERERPLAIGECGLDYFIEELDPQAQARYFDGQLALARRYGLPLIVHARRAVEAVILAIRKAGEVRGVVHSFAGSPEQARQLWEHGFMIGLGGPVSYERARRLRQLAATMPLQHLLLETDAPDQPDAGIRGQRNEPARLSHIAEVIAQLRGESAADVAAQTADNARRLFALPG